MEEFKNAIISFKTNNDQRIPIYSKNLCIEILINEFTLCDEEAIYFFDHNVLCRWVNGEPVIFDLEEEEDILY